jgi:hypothetical protein
VYFCNQIFDVSVQKVAEVAVVATGTILDSDKIASGDPNGILRPGKLMEVKIVAVIAERHGSAGRTSTSVEIDRSKEKCAGEQPHT